ncbi:bifunctional hydroxymethylpyrimidine kinase/phosphomethylpyrimidine kinase [Peribacillus muralis]|uniref:bifunctional hydroxymethylpyrimidine kinase/phosphomethylpyrimidine kinase n=1 Tax=Peribacillus muralis TaxID=264697 RepID=UPI001F4EE739|nr:bifunctional hydroxymethylpyrimidine kinase/phosphomethylpyrimidine kinase [Peribacillus muralis]MCK1992756.1 bifunctional hydroxymethylpyrimidine kinase/phosphomethylpyrimidine kinase [Peribacillus muralis]MCK2013311.1 bifunctional hydroxymethylpyrimidine kinase/phosphomethylpyrimidine kinase [Peribacillus muralis]
MKKALTIAGSDSGGGAGIQADIKTFSAHGIFGMSVITAVTAQNTMEVRSVQAIDTAIITDQIAAIFEDIHVDAVKIGMLGSKEIVETVADALTPYLPLNVILDPVMISKSGHHLLDERAVTALKTELLPLATIVTPNIPEAEVLTGLSIRTEQDFYKACLSLTELGSNAVLLKGGHAMGNPNDLFYDGTNFHWIKGERIDTKNTHGTGCTLSSAITSNMANGLSLRESIEQAKLYISEAIRNSFSIGAGHGPVHHFHSFAKKERSESI